MPAVLPTSAEVISAVQQKAQQKVDLAALHDYLAERTNSFTTTGTATAYVGTPVPAVTAYFAGLSFFVTFHLASGAAPTLAISGIGTPPTLVKQNGDGGFSNIAAGDIPINHRSRVTLISATQALVECLPGRRLAQVQSFQTGAIATGTTIIPVDNTIPQITEGDQYMSLVFTPVNAASTLEIDVQAICSSSAINNMVLALFRDAVADALKVSLGFISSSGTTTPMPLKHSMVSGTTSAITFRVRMGAGAAGTTTFNGNVFAGLLNSHITIKEYLP